MKGMSGLIGIIIGIFIAVLIATSLMPTISDSINSDSSLNGTDTTGTLMGLILPFMAILLILAIASYFALR